MKSMPQSWVPLRTHHKATSNDIWFSGNNSTATKKKVGSLTHYLGCGAIPIPCSITERWKKIRLNNSDMTKKGHVNPVNRKGPAKPHENKIKFAFIWYEGWLSVQNTPNQTITQQTHFSCILILHQLNKNIG